MARRSRFEGYVNAMKGQAEKPALQGQNRAQARRTPLSVKDRLSQMKEKAKTVNRKPEKEGK